MPTVEAGWALLGKRPGTSEDIGVIAASRYPLSPAQFQDLILRYDPGNPSSKPQSAAESLPWVTFTGLIVNDRAHLTVAVREWTDVVDRNGRRAAFTRFFCLPMDDAFGATTTTFSDLYAVVKDIPLDWNVPDPFGGAPIPLPLRFTAPETVHGAIPKGGFFHVAAAAAAVLEGSVAVIDAPAMLDQRLRFLDVVAALLPSGARAWLTASTWADSGTQHRLRLSLTRRARDGDRKVALGSAPNGPQDRVGLDYAKELLRVERAGDTLALMRYLAARSGVRERNPSMVYDVLVEFDLPGLLVRTAADGTLQPERVRRLSELGRFHELTAKRDAVPEVLVAYLARATAEDLAADVDLLAEHWSDALTAQLERVGRARLWHPRQRWDLDALRVLVDVTDRVGARPALLAALWPEESHPAADYARAAAVVERIAVGWGRAAVAATVGRSDALSVAVVLAAARRDHDAGAEWVLVLDRLPARQTEGWAVVAAAFRLAVLGRDGEFGPREVEALDELDPSAGPELLRLHDARFGAVSTTGILRGVLAWLGGSRKPRPPAHWLAALEGLDVHDDALRARTDLHLYLSGRTPRTPPADAVFWGHAPRTQYVDTFIQYAWATSLRGDARQTLVRSIVDRLKPGWGSPDGRFGAVIDLLWGLSQPPNGNDRIVDEVVESAVITEVRTRAHLLRHPSFADWWKEIRASRPQVAGPIMLDELRALPADATAEAVVDRVVTLLVDSEQEAAAVVAALVAAQYRPSARAIVQVVNGVSERLDRGGHARPFDFAHQFGCALSEGKLGRDLADQTPKLIRHYTRAMAVGAVMFGAAVQARGNTAGQDEVRRQMRRLDSVRQNLDETVKAAKRKPAGRSLLGRGRVHQEPPMLEPP